MTTNSRVEQMIKIHNSINSFFISKIKESITFNDYNINYYINTIIEMESQLFNYIQIAPSSIKYLNFGNNMSNILKIIHISSSILFVYYHSLTNNCKIEKFTISNLENFHIKSLELFKSKNEIYGDAFAKFGVMGVLVRMSDKIMRFKKLINLNHDPDFKIDNESTIDTLIDLSNYCAMALMLLEEQHN